jgi:hypothetical protein
MLVVFGLLWWKRGKRRGEYGVDRKVRRCYVTNNKDKRKRTAMVTVLFYSNVTGTVCDWQWRARLYPCVSFVFELSLSIVLPLLCYSIYPAVHLGATVFVSNSCPLVQTHHNSSPPLGVKLAYFRIWRVLRADDPPRTPDR